MFHVRTMGSLPLDRHGLRVHRERNRATHALTLLTSLLSLGALFASFLSSREWADVHAQRMESRPTVVQLVMLPDPGTLASDIPITLPSPSLTDVARQAASSRLGGDGGEVANPGQTGLATDLGGQTGASANARLMAPSPRALKGSLTSGSHSIAPVQATELLHASASGARVLTTQAHGASWSLPELYQSEAHVQLASDVLDPSGRRNGHTMGPQEAAAPTRNQSIGQAQALHKGALEAATSATHEGQHLEVPVSSAVLASHRPQAVRQAGSTNGQRQGQQSSGLTATTVTLAAAASDASRSPSHLSGASDGARPADAEGTPGQDGSAGPARASGGDGLDESMDDLRQSLGWGALDRSQLAARQAHATSSAAGASSATRSITAVKVVDELSDSPIASYLDQVDSLLWAAWVDHDLDPHERALGIQGDTTVDFIIERDGRVVDVVIRSESGHHRLDAMAHSAVPRRLPRLPRSFRSDRILHRVIFHYRNPITSQR